MPADNLRIGTYKGQPMVVFGPADDKFPFQFQKGKAAKIVEAIAAHGLHQVLESIYTVAGVPMPSDLC